MTFRQALAQWEPEARKAKENLDKMRLWIKWACQVRPEDRAEVEKFTEMVENEVFPDAKSV